MIKNVVFDFGQVLVHFEPKDMTEKYIKNEEDAKLVEEVLFDRLYWDKLDENASTDDEVMESVYTRLPKRLHQAAKQIYYNWIYNIPEVEGMKELIVYIKEKYGVSVFLLSNISKYFADHSDEIPILKHIENCVFSSVCGFVKPNRNIFEHLCCNYNILPEETVFIDDNENNVRASEEFGIKTYMFKKDVAELKAWLDKVLSKETGESMFEKSRFIKADSRPFEIAKHESNAPMFRKTFKLEKVNSARLCVCGLGIGYYYINGKSVSNNLFTAPVSDYNKTLWYNTYDVTNLLKEGDNIISVILGNGMYNESVENTWNIHKASWRDVPKFILELYVDGKLVISSDESWKCTPKSATVYNELRVCEVFDNRLYDPNWLNINFDDSAWNNAVIDKNPPKGIFRECTCEPICEHEEYKAKYIGKTPDKKILYDIGQNISGYVKLTVKGEKGQEITLRHAECLKDDESIFLTDNGYFFGAPYHTSKFICTGEETTWSPKFSYYGFRYIEVCGIDNPDLISMSGVFVHQNIEVITSFECSNEKLNKLFECGIKSSFSNMFYMITDCPTREKLGWANDAQMSTKQFMTNFKAEKLLSKWLVDIYDSMNEEGNIPGIIPTNGWGFEWGSGPVASGVMFEIPYRVYLHTGKTDLLTNSIEYFDRYFDFIDSIADEDGFVSFGLPDWTNPVSDEAIPVELINALLVSHFYEIASLAMKLLCKNASLYKEKSKTLKEKTRKRYIDENGRCIVNEQTAVAMLVYFDAYDDIEPLKNQLKELIEQNGFRHSCGMVGLRRLYPALNKLGLEKYAYKILTASGYPSYYNWLLSDATTLHESWDKLSSDASRNHHMYSSFMVWMVETILGIRMTSPSYKTVEIKPFYFEELDYAKGSCDTKSGKIEVSWKKEGKFVTIEITVPKGTSAVYRGQSLTPGINKFAHSL